MHNDGRIDMRWFMLVGALVACGISWYTLSRQIRGIPVDAIALAVAGFSVAVLSRPNKRERALWGFYLVVVLLSGGLVASYLRGLLALLG